MNYTELNDLYKNNDFRKIDADARAKKFYLLRSISKSITLKRFRKEFLLDGDLDSILQDDEITVGQIEGFIKRSFVPKTTDEMQKIEAELNKLQNFDWGGSAGNNLKKIS